MEEQNKKLSDYLMGEMTPDEAQKFEQELQASPELQQRLTKMQKLCQLVESNNEVKDQMSEKRKNELLKAANEQETQNTTSSSGGRLLRFPSRFGWAAAAILIAVGFTVLEKNTDYLSPAYEAETSATAPEAEQFSKGDLSVSLKASREELKPAEITGGGTLSALGYVSPPSATPSTPSPPVPGSTAAQNQVIGMGGGAGGKFGGRGGIARKRVGELQLRNSLSNGSNAWRGLGDSDDSTRPVEHLGYLSEDAKSADKDFAFDADDDRRRSYRGRWGSDRHLHGDEIIGHFRRRPHESVRDMFFRYYGDNAAVITKQDALSTFAADVDTASWALTRSYIEKSQIPPKASVRTEEFLNWFDFDLAAPSDGDFAVHMSATPSRYAQSKDDSKVQSQMLNIGIKARELAATERKPFNLVFVIDRSGSMRSGIRMDMVKKSLGLLLDQLQDDDTVGIVSFESVAHLDLEPTAASERWKIREAINGIEMGGSTNAADGLFKGYELAERAWRENAVNRVVFCSDGVANTGEVDQKRILEYVKSCAERSIDLTTIGVGMGNHNDVFLEQLANDGDGSCHYIDSYEEAKHILVERFIGTMQTIARDVKIQVEFNPDVVPQWRQLGYENRAVADKDFRNDKVDAGEIGAGHAVSALYEYDLRSGIAAETWVAKVRLRWFPDGAKEAIEKEWQLSASQSSSWNASSFDNRVATITAQFAEFLRRSYWTKGDSYQRLVADSQTLLAEDPGHHQLKELAGLIMRTRDLVEKMGDEDSELAILIEEGRRLHLLEAAIESQEEVSSELQARLEILRQRNQELEEEIRRLLE